MKFLKMGKVMMGKQILAQVEGDEGVNFRCIKEYVYILFLFFDTKNRQS